MISDEQRARLAQRLARRVDATDRGDALPATAAALALPEGPVRLEALVEALAVERVIVPVLVEGRAQADAGHHPGGVVEASFPVTHTDRAGAALSVYTSAAALAADRPGARPMPSPVRTPALAALVDTGGRIVVDPAGAAVVLPRPATAALAQGDRWLPAWRDGELLAELRRLAGAGESGAIVDVRVAFGGDVLTRVELVVAADGRARKARAALAGALTAIGSSPRLRAAVDRVELVPVWARLA